MKVSVILLLALVVGVFAGPINVRYNERNTCATRCTESNNFKYEPGTTYVFDYNVQTETSMEGASEDRSALGITATAHIHVISKCDMALTLTNVRIFPKSSSYFIKHMEAQPLRFAFQDGVIEDLCPLEGEHDWVLNIKRGILSTFQNSMAHLEQDQTVQETDVTGKCPAEYRLVSKGWYTKAIKKTKNLLGCMDRHGWRSSMQASAYRVPSDLQSLPLMKSEHVCDQEIENRGYLKSTTCKETHVFRPFSHYNNGSTTKVIQKLMFRNHLQRTVFTPTSIDRKTTMLFTHSEGQTGTERKQKMVENKLSELCDLSKNDIRPDVPTVFSDMIFLMRGLDATALRDIYRQAERGSICSENSKKTKKFFLDAIPMVSTSGSVQLLKELLISKTVTGVQAEMWLTTLALIQSPTREMVSEVKAILDVKELENKALLPITSLVNNYCTKNPGCADEHEVTGIIYTLQRRIGYGCYVRDDNLEKVLLTLRAIGNAGHSTDVGSTVSNCFTRQSNPAEVRVSALDAYRRLPCSVDRSEPMSILADTDEDSEIRIAAYLAVMRCPSETVITDIRNIMSAEDANQVGSFIWSHLANLMETSSPHKQSIRSIIENQRLKKEFDLEKIKYSRNYEGSFMFERLNTGAVAESNVIWSSKSFLPRSLMVNLTVDLFGNSVNLFEVGGRVEGLEYLLETYLGPFGYFGEKSTKASVEKSRSKLDEMRGSMYMRMFGNEMSYKHFKGIKGFTSSNFNFLEFLIDISKTHDYSFSQSLLFLDSSMIIPTSSGLPLNLTVNGVSSIDIQASGSVDLRKVATSPRSLHIEGTIKPSGAVTVTGSMSIDAFVTKSGMKMTSTLHSSTAVTGRIRLERGKILEVVFDMPQDKMEILDVKSTFFTINGDVEKEQAMITDNQRTKSFCTGSKLAKIVGLEMCGEMKYPNASSVDAAPYFPFTGPVSLNLILHKRDTHVGYKLLAKRLESKEKSIGQIAFDTPGSRISRAISLDFVLNFPSKELEISSTSPWTHMILKGNIINTEKQKAFTGSFIKDGERYAINSLVNVNNEGQITKLSPRIEIIRPRVQNIVLAGSVDIEGKKRFSTDLSLIGVINHPISVKGSIVDIMKEKSLRGRLQFDERGEYTMAFSLIRDSNKQSTFVRYTPNISIQTPTEHVASIVGSIEHKRGRHMKGDITTTIKELLPKPIKIKFNNVMKQDKKKTMRYNTDIMIGSKWVTAKVDGSMLKTKSGGITTRLSVDYNMPGIKKNKITISGKFSNKSNKNLRKYILNTNVDVKRNPEYNFITNVDISHNNRHSGVISNIKYGDNFKNKNKMVTFDATINHKGSVVACSVEYKINSKIPCLNIDVDMTGIHKHDRKYLQNNMLMKYGNGKQIRSNLKLTNGSNAKQINMRGVVFVAYPGLNLSLSTDINQNKRKKYVHNLSWKINNKKSTITTIYSKTNRDKHELKSEVFVHSLKPITVTGFTNLNLDKFKAGGSYIQNESKYGFAASKTSSKKYNHDISGDIYYPGRKISADIKSDLSLSRYSGTFDTKWNADKNSKTIVVDGVVTIKSLSDMDGSLKLEYPENTITVNAKHQGKNKINTHVDVAWSPKKNIDLDFTYSHSASYTGRNIGTTFTVTTPFELLPKVMTEVTYDSNNKGINTNSRVIWGTGTKQITTGVFIKRPISLSRFETEFTATTPFEHFRRMSADITHQLSDKLTTNIKGALENKNAELTLTTGIRGDPNREIAVDANIKLRSNIQGMESMSAQINHMHDYHKYITDVVIDHNGEQYVYDLDMTSQYSLSKFDNAGKLVLVSPNYRISSSWNQVWSPNNIKSTIKSDWGSGRKLYVDVSGNYENTSTRKIIGQVILQTPWEPVKNVQLDLKHGCGTGILAHTSSLRNNLVEIGSCDIKYSRNQQQINMDITATNPYTDDLKGSLSVSNTMPITGHMELEWTRQRKITIDGSLSGNFPANIGTLRLTTPYMHPRSIVLTASNKKEGDDWVTAGNVEYNIRKSIQIETRLGLSDMKIFRAKLVTPFDNMRKIETGLDFSVGRYDVSGQADLEILPLVGKFSTSVRADWHSKLTGKIRMDTPFRKYPYAQMEVSSSEDTKGRQSEIVIEYSPNQVISLNTFNNPIIVDINLKSPFDYMEDVGGRISHIMGRVGMQTNVKARYAPYKTISGDLRVKWNKGIDGHIVVKTPFRGYEVSKSSFSHGGMLTDFKTHGNIEAFNERIDVNVAFKHGKSTVANVVFDSSLIGFEEIKASLNKQGGLSDLDFTSSLNYGKREMTVNLHNKALGGVLKTEMTLTNPYTEPLMFTIDHHGIASSFQTKISSSFGRDNMFESTTKVDLLLPKIDITCDFDYLFGGEGRKIEIAVNKDGEWNDMRGSIEGTCNGQKASLIGNFKFLNSVMGSLTFTTPYFGNRDISVSFSHDGSLKRFQSEGNARYLDHNISGKLSLHQDGFRRVNSVAELSVPITGFEQLSYDYQHALSDDSLTGHAKVSYGYNKELAADVKFSNEPELSGSITITTPFEDFINNHVALKGEGSLFDFKIHGEAELYGERLNIDSNFSHDYKTTGMFNMKGTSQKIDDISASFDMNGRLSNFKALTEISYGGHKMVECKVSGFLVPKNVAYTFNLQGLFMEDLSASFEHTGTPMVDCHTKLRASAGADISASYSSSIVISENNQALQLDGQYMYYGEDQKASLNLKKEGDWTDGKISVNGKVKDDDISVSTNYRFTDYAMNFGTIVNTTFRNFRDLAAQLSFSNGTQKVVKSLIRYMDGKEINVIAKFEKEDWKNLIASASVATPFSGFEKSSIQYNHNMNDASLKSTVNVEYAQAQKIASILIIESRSENTFDWNIKTPFKSYRSLSLSANMNKNKERPSAGATFKLGRSSVYSVHGNVDTVSSPISGEIIILTPFDSFDKTDLKFTYSGEWSDFRSSVHLNSKPTGSIENDVSFTYKFPKTLDTALSFKSQISNMELFEVIASNKPTQSGTDSHVSVAWDPARKIAIYTSYDKHSGWSSVEHTGSISLTTPFDLIRSTNIKMINSKLGDKYTEKVSADLNEESILDMNFEVDVGDHKQVYVNMNKPRKMAVNMNFQSERNIEGEIFVNWDKQEPQSNIRIQTSFKPNGGRFELDKEFSIKLIHPARTMGISGILQTSSNLIKSKGSILWNEHKGHRIAYDLDLSDSSRRNKKMIEASLKIEVPTRTIAFQGAVHATKSSKRVDGFIMWDADKDQTKKIGVKASLEPGRKTHKGDVAISLPSINRDIRIGSEMTIDSGRILFDGRTEFSYSSDERKTLVLTSNMKDVSYDREHKNYTMSLGIRHPYTNTDILVISHMGRTSNKLSTGVAMQYLSSARKRINMMLLGEIDQLRRQINVDVISPLKRVRVIGEVDSMSPFHATVRNEIDDNPGMSAELSVDCEKKTFDFQTSYNPSDLSDTLHVEGRYVNSSAIQTEAYTTNNGRKSVESLVEMRLNTSRILHTKITWRPEITREFRVFSNKIMTSLVAEMKTLSDESRHEVGQEIHYKYSKIVNAIEVELQPFIDMFANEFKEFEKELEFIAVELKRMYGRNDLYIQDMGQFIQTLYWKGYIELLGFIEKYRAAYGRIIQTITSQVEYIKSYPIREQYYQIIYKMESYATSMLVKLSQSLDQLIRELKDVVQEHSDKMKIRISDIKSRIANHPRIQMLKDKIIQLQKLNYGQYINEVTDKIGMKVGSLNLVEKYNNAIYNVHFLVNQNLEEIMKRDDVKYLHSMANDVYQEGKWAYSYWRVEDNVKSQMQELYKLIKQLVEEEYEQYKQMLSFLPQLNITVYDPARGELQADVYLPIPITSLDTYPTDVYSGYIHDAKLLAESYIPTKESVIKMYSDYFPESNKTDPEEFQKDLQEYIKSTPKRHSRNSRRRVKAQKF